MTAAALVASACSLAGAACVFDQDCADGDFCNGIERCEGGECLDGAPIPCEDGDPCTLDVCIADVGCSHAELLCPPDCAGLTDGARCADGTVCTVGDSCNAGVCSPGPPPPCPDRDACTSASCDPVLGCVYTEEFVSGPCVPDCSGTVADFTRCPGDGDLCTIDACLPSADFSLDQCIDGLLLFRQCSDGDVCNGAEWCSSVLGCQAGPALDCDDGEICNGTETCDVAAGCQPGAPLPDGEACDDGLSCTTSDACSSGSCVGQTVTDTDCSDGNPATADQCREGFGCLNCYALGIRRLKFKFAVPGKANGRLKARATVDLPAGLAVLPASETMEIIIDADGNESYRATLPAGSLDQASEGRFRFRDKSGSLANGLRRVRLRERKDSRLNWSWASAGLSIDVPLAASVTLQLLLGDDCFLATVPCTTKSGGRALSCKP